MTKEQVQSRIDEVRDEIKHLQSEEQSLQEELKSIIKGENTKALLNEIYKINGENSMSVRLNKDTRTTQIMDGYYHSEKVFLVFKDIFSIGKNWTRVSLVVAKGYWDVNLIDSGLTMTDLKKNSGTVVDNGFLKWFPKTSRFYSLAEELLKASTKISEKETMIPFENPIRLGGQTYANQTGYGSTYEGSFQVTQGTLYGETTGFNIIGIVRHDFC